RRLGPSLQTLPAAAYSGQRLCAMCPIAMRAAANGIASSRKALRQGNRRAFPWPGVGLLVGRLWNGEQSKPAVRLLLQSFGERHIRIRTRIERPETADEQRFAVGAEKWPELPPGVGIVCVHMAVTEIANQQSAGELSKSRRCD